MEMLARGAAAPLQSVKAAVQELFDLYLGSSRTAKNDDTGKDHVLFPAQKRIIAANKPRAPNNEQFILDFKILQSQFPDQEQLRIVVEPMLATQLASCSAHMVQVEFLLSAVQALSQSKFLNWDSFLILLLKAAAAIESSGQSRSSIQSGAGSAQSVVGGSTVPAQHSVGILQVSAPVPPASPASVVLGSPAFTVGDSSVSQSPAKLSDPAPIGLSSRSTPMQRSYKVASWLRQVVCKVIFLGNEAADLQPLTCLEVLSQVVQWIHSWDAEELVVHTEEKLQRPYQRQHEEKEWLYSCLKVVRDFVNEAKGRMPFYALLHDRTLVQIETWPDDPLLFAFFLEVHRRRDKIAFYMQMLDQHLQCPTFATGRMTAFAYQGAMGEPLYGEDIAASVARGTIEWEKALRCLKHSLHAIPSSDWWRRVLISAPRFSQQRTNAPRPGYFASSMPSYVFTAEMTCEAVVDRILELMQPAIPGNASQSIDVLGERWQEWLSFLDLFYFLVRYGYLDILEFIDILATYCDGDQSIVKTNHVTWLLAQVFLLETVTAAMANDPKKVETTQKILSFHKEHLAANQGTNILPQDVLLDFVSGNHIMHLWKLNPTLMEHLAGKQIQEHLQKGNQIDEWWKQAGKSERILDFSSLDEKSMGMFWVISLTMSQPVCDAMMSWMKTKGIGEILLGGSLSQSADRLLAVLETRPLSMTLLSGLSLRASTRFLGQIEDQILGTQVLPSIAIMETYARLLLVAPLTLFHSHVNGMMKRYQQSIGKSGISISILELLNYRLLPLYRYHGKVRQLLYDIAKIVITMKTKRGEHRLFRLAENLCLNLVLSLSEVILMKRELKGAATEFTETLNRAMIINLAITIKTRGIAEFEQQILPSAIEQILANSVHGWSEKTLRYFPSSLRDILVARPDKKNQTIQGWQQAETTVRHHCRQLLAPTADPSLLINFFNHVFSQHRQYLCAAAWILLEEQADSINTGQLSRLLKELSADEVTANIYVMVDVLLYNAQLYVNHGHPGQDILYRINTTLVGLVWKQEIFPFDILLLALADRDDDPFALRIVVSLLFECPDFEQKVQNYCRARGSCEHWLNTGPFQRTDPEVALGNHLVGKDRFPVFFDDMCGRALPVFTLLLFRFIENDLLEIAEKLLEKYSTLFTYHPTRFTFVRDTLAYFYGNLSSKFVIRLLSNLDLNKIPFSDAFLQDLPSSSSGNFTNYLSSLLINLVNIVVPPLSSKVSLGGGIKNQPIPALLVSSSLPEIPKAFYQHQDPGTYPQLVLETAVIELLSLSHQCDQIVSSLVQITVRAQPSGQAQPQSGLSQPHLPTTSASNAGHPQSIGPSNPKSPLMSSSPPGATGDSYTGCTSSSAGSGSSSSTQNMVAPPLMIQACGLLLAQLPIPFHLALYSEAARMFNDCWWMKDSSKLSWEMDAAYGYSVWDPTWAVENDTATIIGNLLALLHAFSSHLPFDRLEGMHSVISIQRPITSVAQLRLAFRIIGPLLPRLVSSKPLFMKTLALLFSILADVFGQKPQQISINVEEILDVVDFLHHAVMLDGPGRPRPDILALCGKGVDRLHPDLQPLFSHLSTDTSKSYYAATHPKLSQKPPASLMGSV